MAAVRAGGTLGCDGDRWDARRLPRASPGRHTGRGHRVAHVRVRQAPSLIGGGPGIHRPLTMVGTGRMLRWYAQLFRDLSTARWRPCRCARFTRSLPCSGARCCSRPCDGTGPFTTDQSIARLAASARARPRVMLAHAATVRCDLHSMATERHAWLSATIRYDDLRAARAVRGQC